jgi:HAD superfamily hydrolase (TIGR01509 family)
MSLRGVIFDVDGTLVDSNDLHARAWVEALGEAGHPVPFERVRRLIGMGGDKLLPAVTGVAAESEEGKAIADLRGAIFRERYLPNVRAFEGARDLVRTLKERGLHLAVASSAAEEELAPLLRAAGADDLIEKKTSGDDVERSKPDPDVVTAALRKLGCAPHEAVMIGDTPYDIEAARAAGVPCIAFRSGGWGDAALAGAVAIHDGPLALLHELETSALVT